MSVCGTCGGYGYARGGQCWTCGGSGSEPEAAIGATEQVGIGAADEPKAPTEQAEGAVVGDTPAITLRFDSLDALADALRGRSEGLVPWDRFCSEWPADFAEEFRLLARRIVAANGVSHQAPTPASVSPGTEGA